MQMKLKAPNHDNINHGSRRVEPGEVVDVAASDVESLKALGWTDAEPKKPKKQLTKKDGDK
jgi:hypothetical protein